MEHTFKIEKELKITTENIVDCVLSCEAGGFDYWGELCSDEKDYEAARQRLAEREKADMKPCLGRAVSKSFSPSVIIPGGAVMENKYVSFEVYRPAKSPTEKGEYMGKTPNLEQARRAADAVGGALYGITSDGRKVLLL